MSDSISPDRTIKAFTFLPQLQSNSGFLDINSVVLRGGGGLALDELIYKTWSW